MSVSNWSNNSALHGYIFCEIERKIYVTFTAHHHHVSSSYVEG